jgi:hypothetical protein
MDLTKLIYESFFYQRNLTSKNAKQLIINYTNLQCLQMLKVTTLAIRDQPYLKNVSNFFTININLVNYDEFGEHIR